jgi:hypothetical protein
MSRHRVMEAAMSPTWGWRRGPDDLGAIAAALAQDLQCAPAELLAVAQEIAEAEEDDRP